MQKTLKDYNNFKERMSFLHMYRSYTKAIKSVGWKQSTQNYCMSACMNISNDLNRCKQKKYKSKGFVSFVIPERGKERFIRSVHISERIIQKCLCDYVLIPVLKQKLIYDNGATLKHKGFDFTIERVIAYIQKLYKENPDEDIFGLAMDYHSYFDNIDNYKLLDDVNKLIYDEHLFYLYKMFILNFGKIGLGLGSQVSQISAIYYVHHIDNLIKHQLHCKYYDRYMDDSLIFKNSKEELKSDLEIIKQECDKYGIILNEKKTQIVKMSKGIPFLKRRWKHDNEKVIRIPQRKTEQNHLRKLHGLSSLYLKNVLKIKDLQISHNCWKSHLLHDNAKQMLKHSEIKYNNIIKNIMLKKVRLLNNA